MNMFGLQTQTEPCFGVAHIAMQSMLAKKIADYDQRNERMRSTKPVELVNQVKQAEEKRLVSKHLLSTEDQMLLEVPVYLQAVKLCQQAYMHQEFFPEGKAPLIQDATSALELVASVSTSNLKNVFSGCYKQAGLEVYCQTLREEIIKFQKPCALILTSGRHAITLGYDILTDEWLLADAYPSPTKRIKDNAALAKDIVSAFSTNEVATFSTAPYSNLEHEAALQNMVDEWRNHTGMKEIHTVNKENATLWKDSHNATWLYVAAQCGDDEKAQTLLEFGADANVEFKDKSTPLFVSVQNRNRKMTALLERFNANSSQPGVANITPTELKTRPGIYHAIGFHTEEHEEIGNAAETLGIDGNPLAELDVYQVSGPDVTQPHPALQQVTFAELVAMPDYFEIIHGAISDHTNLDQTDAERIGQFTKAFNKMARSKHLDKTVDELDEATRQGNINVYEQTAADVACCGVRYLKLIKENFDHFAPDAWFAYKAGHQKALEMAKIAYTLRDTPVEATKYLETAYAMDGFACHFVSDNFSAGHLRTPRRKLVEQFGATIGGALSGNIHDEDCAFGIEVQNARGDKWTCYGDGNLNTQENAKTKAMVMELVKSSAKEIYHAFLTGEILTSDKFAAKTIIPKPIDDIDPDLDKLFKLGPQPLTTQMPLFIVRDEKIHVRSDLKSRACTEYKELTMLQAIIIAVRIRAGASPALPHLHQNVDPAGIQSPSIEDLEIFRVNIERVLQEFIRYSPVKAFFERARDSHNAAIGLQQTITSSKLEDIPRKLYDFFIINTQSTKLEKELATFIQMFAERLGHTRGIHSRIEILDFLGEELGLQPLMIEEPARSHVFSCC